MVRLFLVEQIKTNRFIKKWGGYKLNTFFLVSIAVILTSTSGGIGNRLFDEFPLTDISLESIHKLQEG